MKHFLKINVFHINICMKELTACSELYKEVICVIYSFSPLFSGLFYLNRLDSLNTITFSQ